MERNSLRQSTFAVLAALIWGTAFVAQSVGAEHVPALAFNASRSVIAFVFLLILCTARRTVLRRQGKPAPVTRSRKDLLVGGFCCGTALALASFFQQKGLETTSSGKAGFITALYIVLVPIFGVFLKKRVPRTVWFSVALAVVGLYCLCVTESFTIAPGDICVVLCAFVFTTQILLVDHFVAFVDGIELSCCQFFFVMIFSLTGTLAFEQPTWSGISMAAGAILYAGFFSSGVAYTLQILAQKGSNPTVISLLLSLESVFATISSAIILGDRLNGKEYIGCWRRWCWPSCRKRSPRRRHLEHNADKNEKFRPDVSGRNFLRLRCACTVRNCAYTAYFTLRTVDPSIFVGHLERLVLYFKLYDYARGEVYADRRVGRWF